jgi:TRAP-type C4-dicarboxylate transport system permease small subunit
MRYVFSKPTLWSLEINTFLIVFLALIPAGDVLRSDKHFKITFFQDKLGVLGHKIQAIASNLLGCAFCSIMILEGYEMMFLAWRYEERMSTSLGTPLFLPYLLIPLGFGALLLQFLINLVSELFSQRFTEKDDDSFLNADSHTSKT